MNKIYLIKNMNPWMLDELLAFSKYVNFKVVLIRKPLDFYKSGLEKLRNNGVEVLIKPFKYNYLFKKIFFILKFLIINFLKFSSGYSAVIGLKSLYWFIKLDLNIFVIPLSLHAQFATQASIISLILKKFFGQDARYFFTFHAYDIYFNNKWFNLLLNNSEKALSISEYNIKYVLNKYGKLIKNKIKLSRLGVFRTNVAAIKNQKNDKLNLGFLGRFVEKKGINYLLPALKELKRRKVKFTFHFAGDGPLKEKIIKYIIDNKLEDVTIYYGVVNDERKIEFLSNLDVLILPAIKVKNDMDGIPVVLMEAISYGLPIIATDISGIPEICKNNYNGYLLGEKSIDEIINAILNIVNNKHRIYYFRKNSLKISKSYDIYTNSFYKLQLLKWMN